MHTYPGVYVEELPGGARPIAGVATSDAAFVDWFPRGRMNVATRVTSWPDFERTFGGLDASSTASWHIRQFFLNGGGRAWIVRIGFGNLTAAAIQTTAPAQQTLAVSALNPGAQGNEIRFAVLHDNANNGTTFELLVRRYVAGGDRARGTAFESFDQFGRRNVCRHRRKCGVCAGAGAGDKWRAAGPYRRAR